MRIVSFYSFILIGQNKEKLLNTVSFFGRGVRSRPTFNFQYVVVNVVSSYKNKILTGKCTITNMI